MSGSGDARPSLSQLLDRDRAESALADAVRRWAPRGADARVRHGAAEPVGPWPAETWERVLEEWSAWHDARRTREGEERRLARRARDLDRLQKAGRRAAEARDPAGLLDALGEQLADAGSPDCVQWVVQPPRGPLVVRHGIARPLDETTLDARAREAASAGGLAVSEGGAACAVRAWPVFDASLDAKRRWPASGRLAIPLRVRGRTVGVLAAYRDLPWRAPDRRPYDALAALASLHLERIWTVEAAEAGRFRAVLDAMAQAVFQVDGAGRLVHWNRSAESGVAGKRIPGRPLRALEGTPGAAAVERVLRGREAVARTDWAAEDGRRLSLTATALEAGSGSTGGAVLVLEDVTERTRLQEQLAQSEKLSSLGQMLSGVAHELNNPLASILGYAQLLQMHAPEDEKLRARLEILREEAGRCQKIVGNLLSFARRRPPEMRPFGLGDTVRGVLQLMGYQLRTAGIEADLDIDPDLPPAHGDDHQLQQVLVNLITNAIHALEGTEGGRRLRVRTVSDAEGRVGFEIEDNGPGIPEDVRKRIFDPFFTTKDEGKGTGLGLSLVYGIVHTHRGTIEVEPGEEGGARFRVLLPAAATAAGALARKAGASPAGRPKPGEVSPARILLVEDERALRRMMREALEAEGHRVASVEDGRAALAALSMERFDLVLSDLRMPSMDGRKLVQSLERDHAEMLDRLLLTTGDTLGTDAERFAGERGLPLLRKPFDLEELRFEVRRRLTPREG